jgi:hypothetical protein
MLEPEELPDDLCDLERDLSQLSASELPVEVRSRTMQGVRLALHRDKVRRRITRRVIVAACLATAATALVIIRPQQESSQQGLRVQNRVTVSIDELPAPVRMPTIQAYRLSYSDSPDDWEKIIESRAKFFLTSNTTETVVLAWNDQHQFLEDNQ